MKVHLPKGTRDFLPTQMIHRSSVIDRIRAVFRRYGFEPLETPAFERIETLLGKYGDEGDKLVFKILKRGKGSETGECDQALRYDLTVPLARVMAMHPELRLPFKRYQIQPVWRADRPQKGRYREFYQCDVDVIGTPSPSAEAECIAVVAETLTELGFERFTVRLNDRRILAAIAAELGVSDRESTLLIILDKLDKIGRDGVSRELLDGGFASDVVDKLWTLLAPQADNTATLAHLGAHLSAGEGVETLREVLVQAQAMGVDLERVLVDPTLARGLDYYTGPVFETIVEDGGVGSLSGGGRYDGLIGMFSGRDVPAVGVSLGIERILALLAPLEDQPRTTTEVFVTVFDDAHQAYSTSVATALRRADIATELYLGTGRLKSQFKHANARGYPWLLVVGPGEMETDTVSLKNLSSGEQHSLSVTEAIERIRTERNAHL